MQLPRQSRSGVRGSPFCANSRCPGGLGHGRAASAVMGNGKIKTMAAARVGFIPTVDSRLVLIGGFGSVFGAFAGGIIIGLVEAITAMILPPSLKSVGIYSVYLAVVFLRPRGLFGSI